MHILRGWLVEQTHGTYQVTLQRIRGGHSVPEYRFAIPVSNVPSFIHALEAGQLPVLNTEIMDQQGQWYSQPLEIDHTNMKRLAQTLRQSYHQLPSAPHAQN